MPVVHEFDPPERFVAGTVGEPGARTFFLQARSGPRLVSVALEKQQVQVLAERIDELLDEVMPSSGTETLIPAVAPVGLEDTEPLEQPIEEQFRAGTMTLSWDPGDRARRDRGVPADGDRRRRRRRTSPSPRRSSWSGSRPGPARAFVQRAAPGDRGRPARLPVLRQPDRPRGAPLRPRERLPSPRPGLSAP